MASKTALTAQNLESLGAEALARLLMEISQGDAALKRRLRMQLASLRNPAELAREISKRLATIARSRSFVDWSRAHGLAEDLETQRKAIVEELAPSAPAEALELLWRLLALAGPTYERCDDSSGLIGSIFAQTRSDLGPVALAAKANPEGLADQAFAALCDNDYAQYDRLIPVLAPALGAVGLERLKTRLSEEVARAPPAPVGRGRDDRNEREGVRAWVRGTRLRRALQEIADAQGDVEGFIAQIDAEACKAPRIAAEIASRWLGAGRLQEAMKALEAAAPAAKQGLWPESSWEDVRIEVLEALGRKEEAQAARWSCFERELSEKHLRAWLKRLPEFEDFEGEMKAFDHAAGFGSVHQALAFFLSWPALDRAEALILKRAGELDGDHYGLLSPVAEALSARHLLAAMLCLRSMIDFTLKESRATRYKHAARHLMECASLARGVEDFRSFETHEAYAERLRKQHGRKTAFWSLVS